jgi:hypothetical protein
LKAVLRDAVRAAFAAAFASAASAAHLAWVAARLAAVSEDGIGEGGAEEAAYCPRSECRRVEMAGGEVAASTAARLSAYLLPTSRPTSYVGLAATA